MTMLSAGALLEIRGLRTWFPVRMGVLRKVSGHVRAVDGVDLTIFPGETLALVGESGCGKTTVGRAILQLVDTTGGNIWYRGTNLSLLSSKVFKPYRRQMQVVMQDPGSALDPRLTVRDCIAEGMDAFGIGADYRERTERVASLMSKVSLDPATMWRYPHEFSGGQRQRINIARALAVDPELLICDEATSALDVSIQAQILNLLADLQAERKLTYLFITHDLGVVRYFATRVAVMYLGRIVEVGPTERIFAKPRHPYTKALLASIPSLDPARRSTRPVALGDVPSPEHPPPGCHYHPRCAMRLEQCSREDPPVVAFPDGICRCVLAVEESDAQRNASF
jgi:peptide/nickel transport system ATP-binding protein